MTWDERIREAAYTSPSGVRIVFTYEDVRLTFEKKTTAFEFPGANGTYVQDLGHSGRRYPLRLFFWGDDYDVEAEAFESAIREQGIGKLDHPIYGSKDVVPFGSIARRDDLKTSANQAIFEVTFWETIDVIYPTTQVDPASSVLSSVGSFNTALSEQFAKNLNLSTANLRTNLENQFLILISNTENGLQGIADTDDAVRVQFNAIKDSMTQGIDLLVTDPATMSLQMTQLVQTPAKVFDGVEIRLAAYNDLVNGITAGGNEVEINGLTPESSNNFHEKDAYALAYISGSVVSVVNGQFKTTGQAIEAAEIILNQLDSVTQWREDNYTSLIQIDTGEAYQQIQEAVALAAGFLVQISFSLKQERVITLDRDRTLIDLAAQLYGEVDSQLDFLINSNNLSGSEILELPRGREIAYYV